MAQFKAFRPGIEVSGPVVITIVAGMGEFRRWAMTILAQHGIRDIDPDGWYPQQAFLDAFKTIADKIGQRTLFAIGKQILEQVEWPPWIDRPEVGFPAINVNYHRQHRLDGKLMFNEETGEFTPGLGSYEFQSTGPASGVMLCNNPYPSEFDRGILTAMGLSFKPSFFEARLDLTKPTRTAGADSCSFLLEWTAV